MPSTRTSCRRGVLRTAVVLAILASATLGPAAPASPAAAKIRVHLGVPYETVDGQTMGMDVYVPLGAGPHPGVLLVHGGGFYQGTRDHFTDLSGVLATHGYVAFSIDYRLAPRFTYPAQVQDAITAVEYMREHASLYHLDPARIGALGTSAGGTIVASLGVLCGRGSTDGQVAAVASLSGPLDLERLVQQVRRARSPVYGYVFGSSARPSPAATSDALLRDASPVGHVSPSAPPFLMAVSSAEPFPVAQYREMAGLLRDAHVPVEFFRPPPGDFVDVIQPRTFRFLARYVASYHGAPGAPLETCPALAASTPATTGPVHQTGGDSGLPLVLAIGVATILLALGIWALAQIRHRAA